MQRRRAICIHRVPAHRPLARELLTREALARRRPPIDKRIFFPTLTHVSGISFGCHSTTLPSRPEVLRKIDAPGVVLSEIVLSPCCSRSRAPLTGFRHPKFYNGSPAADHHVARPIPALRPHSRVRFRARPSATV